MLVDSLNQLSAGSSLLVGYLRYDEDTENYYNALVEIDQTGAIKNIYDKHHLVPFGEYIPFQEWIPLKPVVQFQGFGHGEGPVTQTSRQDIKYSPLVCYEILFPGNVIDEADRPDILVNVTNDAWYGESAGPYQHYIKAVYRAVETGLPVIRSANTGISGIIDPRGATNLSTSLFTEKIIDARMPSGINAYYLSEKMRAALFLVLSLSFLFSALIVGRLNTNED